MRMIYYVCVALLLGIAVHEGMSQAPPKREFRAAWVASVTNLDWPSSPGGPAASQKTQLTDMLNSLQAAGINVVIFQVRPECDALYASPYEPWSYWLTGNQGQAASYDPLQFAVEEAHKRGMELHAWFNPYRAVRSIGNYTQAANHVSVQHPDWILTFPSTKLKILDPGHPAVREFVARVVADIVRRYDVDGVHADDYFYPYDPIISTEDAATFASYPRGFSNIGDWRRDNVNLLMKMITDSVAAIKPYVKFGMSPFGIWKNGVPPGIVGLDAYNQIFGDAIAWLHQRTVDYLTPQLYWKIGGSQDYNKLMPWWADSCFANNRHFYPGQIFGTSYTAAELPNQLKADRANAKVGGQVIFRAALLVANQLGYADSLKRSYYAYPSLLPTMAWKDVVPPYMPRSIRYEKTSPTGPAALRWDLPITAPDGDSASRYAVYRFDHTPALPGELADARNMVAVVGERQYVPPTPPAGGPYSYVVTALDRNYNESEPSSVLPLGVPGVPVLASPSNGTTAIPESVLVVWKNSSLASSYHLQVSADSTFVSGLFVNDSTITDTVKVVRGYQGQTRAYWRVRARNASGVSAFSGTFSFVSGAPAIAVLASPPNVSVDQPVVLPIRWNKAQAATSYRLQLSLNASFTPTVFDTAGVADTSIVSPALDYFKIYFWRVKAKNAIGEADWTAYYRFRTVQVSAVAKELEVPSAYSLSQNYPNPFNPTTVVRYQVPVASAVKLFVYDLLGREVGELVNARMEPGTYTVSFDASHLPSGVYFCRMTAGQFVATNRMLLVK
jgi:uncharacterized lipoprotein YddW (UPF0748 family)